MGVVFEFLIDKYLVSNGFAIHFCSEREENDVWVQTQVQISSMGPIIYCLKRPYVLLEAYSE